MSDSTLIGKTDLRDAESLVRQLLFCEEKDCEKCKRDTAKLRDIVSLEETEENNEPWPACGKCNEPLWKISHSDDSFHYKPCSICEPQVISSEIPVIEADDLISLVTKKLAEEYHVNVLSDSGQGYIRDSMKYIKPYLTTPAREAVSLNEETKIILWGIADTCITRPGILHERDVVDIVEAWAEEGYILTRIEGGS